ncbi:MAG: AMP-binding protein, partial [Desulfobacterales bacterium]|nr:AMP-binding protein [Desulfobacterales bacterium]
MSHTFQNLVEMLAHSRRLYADRPIFGTKSDDGFQWITYGTFAQRVDELRGGLACFGIQRGDKVAVISSNCVEWAVGCYATYGVGGHYVPMYESQKPSEWEYIIRDSGARLLFVKSPEVYEQVKDLPSRMPDLDEVVPFFEGSGAQVSYDRLMAQGKERPCAPLNLSPDETMGLIYTSGTTGNPKGVVYHHRGAYLNATSNLISWGMTQHPVYLWTLPMFHCNGWCFPWTIAAAAGVNVCLRHVRADHIFNLIKAEKVGYFCGAPIVLNMLNSADDELKAGIEHGVNVMTAGASPPAAVIAGMEALGFTVTHVYGLTETYGPSV